MPRSLMTNPAARLQHLSFPPGRHNARRNVRHNPAPRAEKLATTTQLYVSFPSNAREVLEFYQSVFGGDLELLTYGEQLDQGVKFLFDPPHDAVAHATLTGPFTITGGDDLERNEARLNRGDLGFTANVETPEEGEALYARLAGDGGSAVMPFALAPWGDYFGVVEDKFGVRWNVTKQG